MGRILLDANGDFEDRRRGELLSGESVGGGEVKEIKILEETQRIGKHKLMEGTTQQRFRSEGKKRGEKKNKERFTPWEKAKAGNNLDKSLR